MSSDKWTHFGTVLRRLRVAELMSQQQLASRSMLSVRTIRDMESGRVTRPRGDTIRMLADALNLEGSARAEFVRMSLPSQAGTPATGDGATSVNDRVAPDPKAAPPAQLPMASPWFAGRRRELAWLNQQVTESQSIPSAVTVVALSGTAGAGKSSLAIRWAHTVRNLFPDGQLYVDMREANASNQKSASQWLTNVLSALCPSTVKLPRTLDALSGIYRSVLADKRILVLLDNVDNAAQVRPLLPGTAGGTVVVTSRRQLVELVAAEGARPLTIGLFDPDDARELLARRIGVERVEADPAATDEIIRLCARLPLALVVVAARAVVQPDTPLRTIAAELDGARGLPDLLTAYDPPLNLRQTFSSIAQLLPPDAVTLLQTLGDSSELTADLATKQVRMPLARILNAIDVLVREHVMVENSPGRFSSHALMLAYARELSGRSVT